MSQSFASKEFQGELAAGSPLAGNVNVGERTRFGLQTFLLAPGGQEYEGVEATVRYAAELGYEVTMVKDATSCSDKEMHAALEVNIPNYATAIVTTGEIVASISSLKT